MRLSSLLPLLALALAACKSSSSVQAESPDASLASPDASSLSLDASPDAPAAPTGDPRTDPGAVHVSGSTLRDGQGRQLLFRGYNAKATTLFDVTFSDGRTANETFNDFDDAAATRIEQLGLDVIRLPVSWSGLEPQPGQYSEPFLQKLAAVLALAKAHHFYVFIDMHQDAYSKEIGEDGEPLWAIVPPPTQLLSGPSDDSRRLTAQVLNAGWSFFEDDPATDGRLLQDAFTQAVQVIVRRVLGDPTVLGYEAFNEPVPLPGGRSHRLPPTLRGHDSNAIDRDAPVLFEPIATRNQNDQAMISPFPWANGPGVYAPHIYTAWFSLPSQNDWASEDAGALAPSMEAANKEATAWATPLFVTEFGCDVSTDKGTKWISAELDLQDQWLASSTAWEFSGRGAWGFTRAARPRTPGSRRRFRGRTRARWRGIS